MNFGSTYPLHSGLEAIASRLEAIAIRFLHICESADDLVMQSQMQRELGRRTGQDSGRSVTRHTLPLWWYCNCNIYIFLYFDSVVYVITLFCVKHCDYDLFTLGA